MRERSEQPDIYDEYDDHDQYDQPQYREQYRDERVGGVRQSGRPPQARERAPRTMPAPARKSRAPIAIAVAAAVVAAGTFAVVKSGVLSKGSSTPSAGSQPATGSAGSPGSAGSAGSAGSPATASTPAPQVQPGLSAPNGGAKVGTFYGIVQHELDPHGQIPSDQAAVPALFASSSQFHTYWSSAGKPTAGATCGAKTPTLAVVETPQPATGTGATVRVDLFEKGKLAVKAAVVGVDGSGRIESIKCVAAAMPTYPGLSYILGTYGINQIPGTQVSPSHTYAPKSQDAPSPDMDSEWNVCAQYSPNTWVFYAPVATSAGNAWRFAFDQVTYSRLPDLFVDPASGSIQRIICEGLPSIPAPDLAAAGKDPHAYGGDPADALVMFALQGYARERSLVSAGAKPTSELAPYFASDDAFQTALSNTGKIPLLCTDKDPFGVVASGIGTVTGTNEVVDVNVLGASADGNRADVPTIGKATYTIDLNTMKITGIACH